GVSEARILDGGLPAWTAAGGELATGAEPDPEAGDLIVRPGGLPVIDADAAATWPGLLLDARAAERFRGDVEPVDPRAGHIPGAVSSLTAENLYATGQFSTPEVQRARFSALGPGPVAVYCGSGVTVA